MTRVGPKNRGRSWPLRALLTAATALVVSGAAVASLGETASRAGAATGGSPIKIGFVCSCSGPFSSDLTDVEPVYRAWANSVNANGGINGHRVDVIYADDKGNPGTSTAIVQTFIHSDHVVAIMDATDLQEAWASDVQRAGIPVIGMFSGDTPFSTNPDFYAEGQTADSLFVSVAETAKKAGTPKLGLMYCAESPSCQQAVAPLNATAKAEGIEVVANLEISATAPNYAAQCLAAKQAGAEMLFIIDGQTVVEKVAADCTAQGYDPKYTFDAEALVEGMASTPGLRSGTYMAVPDMPFFASTPGVKEMDAALNKYAKGIRSHATTYGEIAMQSWISAKLFQAAALAGHLGARGTAPTPAEVVRGLHALNGTTLDGLAPPLHFAAGKANPVDCWYWATIQNGKFKLPFGTKPACSSQSLS